MNEQSHILIKKNTPLTLYSRKGWCFLCVRGELETGTDCNKLTPKVLLTIATLLSHSGWAAQPWVTEGPKPSVCCWLSIRHLVCNWLQLQLELTRAVNGTRLYNCLTHTCFRCSSAYLHRCISWLTSRSRVNIWQILWKVYHLLFLRKHLKRMPRIFKDVSAADVGLVSSFMAYQNLQII